MAVIAKPKDDYLLRPDPADPRLTERVAGVDQAGEHIETSVTVERALTIYLNAQEIVTAMTIGDYPDYLALGYLLNQNMLRPDDVITGVDYDDDLAVVVVRTERAPDYEQKLKKKVQTSGCAQGTVFGDLMELITTAALCARHRDHPPALALHRSGRDPRLRAVPARPAAGLHGGRRPAQRGRQD